jgi:hypothetical protein
LVGVGFSIIIAKPLSHRFVPYLRNLRSTTASCTPMKGGSSDYHGYFVNERHSILADLTCTVPSLLPPQELSRGGLKNPQAACTDKNHAKKRCKYENISSKPITVSNELFTGIVAHRQHPCLYCNNTQTPCKHFSRFCIILFYLTLHSPLINILTILSTPIQPFYPHKHLLWIYLSTPALDPAV